MVVRQDHFHFNNNLIHFSRLSSSFFLSLSGINIVFIVLVSTLVNLLLLTEQQPTTVRAQVPAIQRHSTLSSTVHARSFSTWWRCSRTWTMSRATICQRSMLIPRVQHSVKSFIDLMLVAKVKSFIILAGIRVAVVIRQRRRRARASSGISWCCLVSCPMQCKLAFLLFNYRSKHTDIPFRLVRAHFDRAIPSSNRPL